MRYESRGNKSWNSLRGIYFSFKLDSINKLEANMQCSYDKQTVFFCSVYVYWITGINNQFCLCFLVIGFEFYIIYIWADYIL